MLKYYNFSLSSYIQVCMYVCMCIYECGALCTVCVHAHEATGQHYQASVKLFIFIVVVETAAGTIQEVAK